MEIVIIITKFSAFWSETVTSCTNNSRALWKTVDSMLAPPRQSSSTKLKADEFATFFRDRVDAIRSSTMQYSRVSARSHPALCTLAPVTIAEVTALLSSAASESCDRAGPHSNLALKTSVRPSCTCYMSSLQSFTQLVSLYLNSNRYASYHC